MNKVAFNSKRGCPHQIWLLDLINNQCHRQKKPVFSAFLDLKKAYDSTPIHAVVYKLMQIESVKSYGPYILEWISGHQRRLRIPGNDHMIDVTRGVPQGSVLAPFLFNVLINDLIVEINMNDKIDGINIYNHNIKILLYADDIVLLHPDHKSLQIALDTCSRWSQKWGMTFAPHKSKLMRLGYGSQKFDAKLANQPLEYVNQFKYLGVIFKDNHRNKYLDKSETVATIAQDLKQKAFLFSKKAACPVDVIALLLHSCFMPKLLYGSEVFPIQPKILETYHAKLAKTALCTYGTQSNTKALNFMGWKSAKQQQNERTLKFFFRLIISDYHEICDIALSAFNDQNPLKWVKTIHKLLNEVGMNNNTQLTQNNAQFFAQCGFEKCKHHFRNRSPHQSLIAAPQTARATFMFTVESFNARGHFDELLGRKWQQQKTKQEQRGSKWELWCLPPIMGAAPPRSWEGTSKCDSMRRDSRDA